MNTITQTMRFRQALIEYSLKYGVTKAAIRYKVNRQYVYRWRKGMMELCNLYVINHTDLITIQTNTQPKN